MSLFQAREWWSCPSSASDEYDTGSLCVCDLLGRGEDVVVVASFNGYIRIYSPHYSSEPSTTSPEGQITLASKGETNAGVEDLLLEERLALPVLSISVGRFSSVFPGLSLAILHPHSLAVYSVTSADDAGPAGRKNALFYRLNRLYEHSFPATVGAHFAAANMTFGPFGQSTASEPSMTNLSTKDSIAVQSMDGQLAVFEQERFSFRRNLNAVVTAGATTGAPSNALSYLLPGPLVYVPRTDSIIAVNSEMRVDSFRYTTLASAWSSDTSAPSQPTNTPSAISTTSATADAAAGRKLRPDWTFNIGEHAHHMAIGRLTPAATAAAIAAGASSTIAALGRSNTQGNAAISPSSIGPCEIAIAGERSFFVLRDSGPTYAGTESPSSAAALASAVRTQRKLDYTPACMAVYARGAVTSPSSVQTLFSESFGSPFASGAAPTATSLGHGTIVVSHQGVCHIYKGDTLIWAARLPPNFTHTAVIRGTVERSSPVAVGVGKFAGMPGMLVFLSSRGDVSVCFCGTDPPVGSLTGGETVRDLDYASMDKEHRGLLARIRDMQAAAAAADKPASMTHGMQAAVTFPPTLDEHDAASGGGARGASMNMRSTMMLSGGKEDDDAAAVSSERVSYAHMEWEEDGEGAGPHSRTLTATLNLTWKDLARASAASDAKGPDRSGSEIRVTISTPLWVLLPKGRRTFTLPNVTVSASSPHRLKLPFAVSRRGMPTDDSSVTVAVSYNSEAGEMRTTTVTVDLPFFLLVSLIAPVKTALFKLTVDVNRNELPGLMDIFSDCFHQPLSTLPAADALNRIIATAPAVVSFAYRCGADVTILASKAGGRYRVQAGSLEALSAVTTQLVNRLKTFYSIGGPGYSKRDPAIELSYTEPLPLADFFSSIEAHYTIRRRLLQAYSDLNDRAHEYRLVAKRLLVRWKEKSPQPLNGLDKLIEVAQENVMAAGSVVSDLQDAVTAAANRLACTVALVLLLTRLRFNLSDASASLLSKFLPPVVIDTLEVGWEEMTDVSLTYLLKALTSGVGRGDTGSIAQSLSMPEDTSRLRSHVTLLLDRLSKAKPNAIEEAVLASSSSNTGGSGSTPSATAGAGVGVR